MPSLLILLLLLALSAFFSASETAMFSVDRVRLRTLARKGNASAALAEKLRDKPRILLGAIVLGSNVVTISASAITTVIAVRTLGSWSVGAATGILTVIVIVFSEFLPKAWAAHSGERAALLLAKPVHLLTVAVGPIVRLLDRATSRMIGDIGDDSHVVSEEEIKTMATMGVTAGTVGRGERELIERVFLFNDITAEDVMTPKENVIALPADMPLSEAAHTASASKFSRFPVYDGDPSNVVGIVHIKEITGRLLENGATDAAVRSVASPAIIVPRTKPIDKLLHEFQRRHAHMAVVVNEYGSVIGLATLEDLIEELVGEISDESDLDERTIVRVDKHSVLAHGDVEIEHLNRFFNARLPGPPHRTVGWLLLERIGKIPEQGQEVGFDGITAKVEQVSGRRIERVRFTKTPDN